MGAMLLPSALRQQPRQRLPIDRSNPLGAKVIEHIPLNGTASTASGAALTYGAGGSTAAGMRGRGLRGSGSGSRASVPIDLSSYSAITIAFWLYWDGYANDDALAMEMGATYGANNGLIVDPNCSSPAAFMFGAGGSSASGGSNLLTFPRPSAGVWHRIVLAVDRAGAIGASGAAYVDGVAQPVTAFPGAVVTVGNFGADTLHLLSRNEVGLFGTGNLQDITFYRGVLSAAEAAQDYLNPWQIFKAPPPRAMRAAVSAAPAPIVDTSLAGSAAAAASASGKLSTAIQLAGGATATATASGALTTAVRMAGAALAASSAAGALSTAIPLAGTAAGATVATGALTTSIPLAGSAVAIASAVGALALDGAGLAGAAVAVVTAGGALTTAIRLAGTAQAQAVASGALAAPGAGLNGSARAEATAAGALSTGIRLAGTCVAQASAVGALNTSVSLRGSAAASALAFGALSTKISLTGVASVSSSAGATLSAAAQPSRFDISKIHPSRIAVFGGSGSRVAVFEGSGSRVSRFK